MDNLDLTVLKTLRDWRVAGHRALLATVVRTWGSSPRPVGSIMAMRADGAVVGSVSGGCIEDDLINRYTLAYRGEASADSSTTSHEHNANQATDAANTANTANAAEAPVHAIPSGAPQRVSYGVSADEAHRFGLPCGGTLELLLEFDPEAQQLVDLVGNLDQGLLVCRRLDLLSGQASCALSAAPAALTLDATALVNTFGPGYRMLIIGAGQLSEYLATMALFSGFSVTVCDPRDEYRGAWQVPAAKVVSTMPDDEVKAFAPDSRSCVVALTHDPKLDDLALLEALDTPAFYVGAIGSRRNHASRTQRMIEHFEQTEAGLQRLRGPIGIYIGSKTPPEIAVSVMAEILAVKNNVTLPRDMAVGLAKERLETPHNDPGMVCGVSDAA
jgi:xanthine dehydrogenase accessory factor